MFSIEAKITIVYDIYIKNELLIDEMIDSQLNIRLEKIMGIYRIIFLFMIL